MTTLTLEGFDNWAATSDGNGKGWTFAVNSGSFNLATGRFGGQCINTGQGVCTLSKTLSSAQTTLYFGVALRIHAASIDGTNQGMLFAAYSSGGVEFFIRLTSGAMSTYNNAFSPTSNTITGFQDPVGNWTYIEAEITFATSATGTLKVWQDGLLIYSSTTQQTASSGSGFTSFAFGCPQSDVSGNTGSSIDDIYLSNSTHFGPIRVATVHPTADNTGQQWTPSSGTTNYNLVNAAVQNGGSTYVSAATANDTDLYSMGTIPSGSSYGVPYCVQPVICVQGSGNTLTTKISSGGTVYQSGSVNCPSAYQMVAPTLYDTNPNGSVAWTTSSVNSLLVGMENGNP